MVRFILVGVVVLLLTALTQVGGLVLLLALGAVRLFRPVGLWRAPALAAIFLAGYVACTAWIVPPLAALGGRVAMPCAGEPLRTLPVLCALNRQYVSPPLRDLAQNLAAAVAAEYPGSVTLALDANFPFLHGFPLLPHLSHSDGNKLDLGYYYSDPAGTYLAGASRSPIGYWAFETPNPGEGESCDDTLLTARWGMEALQPLFPDLQLEPERTRFALLWLFANGPAQSLQRVFLEPYLAQRLGVASPFLGFQGCRAARHDDHIHIQIAGP